MSVLAMTDYYPAIARAVSTLESKDSRARQDLYERARGIVVAELRRQNTSISAHDVERERRSLEAAIRRVETEFRSPNTNSSEGRRATHGRASPSRDALSDLSQWLVNLLFGIAFLALIFALTGLIYIRGLMMVYAQVIGYPVLIVAMTIVIGLFIPPSWAVLRRMRA
jgi:Flp pilus assembly protein TadB